MRFSLAVVFVLVGSFSALAEPPANGLSESQSPEAARLSESAESPAPIGSGVREEPPGEGDDLTAEEGESADDPAAEASVGANDDEASRSDFQYSFFADGYLGVNTNLPSVGRDRGPSFAFAPEDGGGLAFAGLDLRYERTYLGASVDVRLGSAVPSLLGSANTLLGTIGIKQAFATVSPTEWLSFDLGQFDTIYGAEVSESWMNPTYTRGALYYIAQPFFHTGLRATIAPPGAGIEIRGLAVQGWNSFVDNNRGKSFGGQLVYSRTPGLTISAGYLGGPEQDGMGLDALPVQGANGRWRHLVDVVLSAEVGRLTLSANADFIQESVLDASGVELQAQVFGVMGAARYGGDGFAVAIRGEYLFDDDGLFTGVPGLRLGTATATFELTPTEGLILKLDARADVANEDVFAQGDTGARNSAFRVVLGVVARTGN